MSDDDRSPRTGEKDSSPQAGGPRGGRRVAGALAGTLAASYALPALAAHLPLLCAPLGIEDRTASGEGYALTFDDGPHHEGTPAVLDILAAAGVQRDVLPRRRAGAPQPRAAARDRRGGPRRRACTASAIATCCASRRARCAQDIDRAQATIEDATGLAIGLYRPPYGVLNATALRLARRRGWRTLLWSDWGRDWEKRATPESIARRVTEGAGAGGGAAAARRRRLQRPGLLAAHRRGAAAGARRAGRAGGLSPVAPFETRRKIDHFR